MSAEPSPDGGVRLAELVALMSLGADLGLGQPMEHALHQCLMALRIGERLGLDQQQRGDLYYVGLLAWVGCHIDAYEQARWFGDDIRMKSDIRHTDFAGAQRMRFMAAHVGAERTGAQRARTTVGFLAEGRHDADAMITNHWFAADDLAARLGLS